MPQDRYPIEIRRQAKELFESGFGYKASADILGIPESIARDWKRNWRRNAFRIDMRGYAEILRDVMKEKGRQFIWRGDEATLAIAYMHLTHEEIYSRRFATRVVYQALKQSPLFEKMHFIAAFRNLSGRTVRYAVYRLKHSEE